MLNQKVSGNSNIIILDCSCSIADPELGLKLYVKAVSYTHLTLPTKLEV